MVGDLPRLVAEQNVEGLLAVLACPEPRRLAAQLTDRAQLVDRRDDHLRGRRDVRSRRRNRCVVPHVLGDRPDLRGRWEEAHALFTEEFAELNSQGPRLLIRERDDSDAVTVPVLHRGRDELSQDVRLACTGGRLEQQAPIGGVAGQDVAQGACRFGRDRSVSGSRARVVLRRFSHALSPGRRSSGAREPALGGQRLRRTSGRCDVERVGVADRRPCLRVELTAIPPGGDLVGELRLGDCVGLAAPLVAGGGVREVVRLARHLRRPGAVAGRPDYPDRHRSLHLLKPLLGDD